MSKGDHAQYAVVFSFISITTGIFACSLIIMASGSRMLYAMARDNVFLGNALFRRVSTTTSVPIPAILLIAVLGIMAELFSESLEQLLAAAAVLPALIYLITVATYAARRKSLSTRSGQFSLGTWGGTVSVLAVVWLVFIIAVLTIPREFHSATWISVAACGVGAAFYFGLIRARIARGEGGVHAADVYSVNGHSDRVVPTNQG